MNLSLNHDDIVTAIQAYVVNQGIQVTGKCLITTITCGRGANGTSAIVELVDGDAIAAGPEKNTKVPSNGADLDADAGIAGEAGESSTGGLFDE